MAKKSRKTKDYFGLPWLVSVLLALFLGPLMGIFKDCSGNSTHIFRLEYRLAN